MSRRRSQPVKGNSPAVNVSERTRSDLFKVLELVLCAVVCAVSRCAEQRPNRATTRAQSSTYRLDFKGSKLFACLGMRVAAGVAHIALSGLGCGVWWLDAAAASVQHSTHSEPHTMAPLHTHLQRRPTITAAARARAAHKNACEETTNSLNHKTHPNARRVAQQAPPNTQKQTQISLVHRTQVARGGVPHSHLSVCGV